MAQQAKREALTCVDQATSSTTITAVAPTSITAGAATTITLTGTVAAGDLVVWATDCSAATPSVDPTDGTNAATSFTVSTAGTYKLCYRANGMSDSVEQTGIALTVTEARAAALYSRESNVYFQASSSCASE